MTTLTSSNYSSNAIVGTPQAGANINLYKTSSSADFAVGFGFTRADGNTYRYVQYGANTSPGHIVSTDISEVAIIGAIATNTGLATDTTTAVDGDPVKPGGKGSHYLEVSLTPTNTSVFGGGYLVVASGAGSGTSLRIKNNTASGTPSTGRSRLEFFDPLPCALDSTSDLSIIGNPYANVEPTTTGTDAAAVGVSVFGGASSTYGWVLTHGIGAVLADASTLIHGDNVMISSTTAGAVTKVTQPAAGTCATDTGVVTVTAMTKYPIVGYCVDPMTSTAFSMVYVTLE